MTKKIKKGFTLTELIVVIAIIAILAAVLIPTSISFIKKAKLSNDIQDAANMTKILKLYEIENDTELVLASDIRAAIISVEPKYDFIPRAKGYHFLYNLEEKKIEVLSDEEAIEAKVASNPRYIEEVYENKMLLDMGGSLLADVVVAYYNITSKTEYDNAKGLAVSFDYVNHFENFTPTNTIFIFENGCYTEVTRSSDLKNVVFKDNITILSENSFPKHINNIADEVIISIPSTVQLIYSGAFENVESATFKTVNNNLKIEAGAFTSEYMNLGEKVDENQIVGSVDVWIIYDIGSKDSNGRVTALGGYSPKIINGDSIITTEFWKFVIGKKVDKEPMFREAVIRAYSEDYKKIIAKETLLYIYQVYFNIDNTEMTIVEPAYSSYKIEYKLDEQSSFTQCAYYNENELVTIPITENTKGTIKIEITNTNEETITYLYNFKIVNSQNN